MRWYSIAMLLAWVGAAGAQPAALQMEVPQAPVVVRIGTTDRLVHELHLRNSGDVSMAIRSVEVLAGDPARPLLLLDGDTLCRQLEVLQPPGSKLPACH